MNQKIFPPGSFGFPLVGETLSFLLNPYFSIKKHQKYGNIFKSHILGKPTIFVQGGKEIRWILTNENRLFHNCPPLNFTPFLGQQSISLLTGEEHLKLRRELLPLFQGEKLIIYGEIMKKIITEYLVKWEEKKTFVWYKELENLALDIIAKILLGVEQISQTPLGDSIKQWKAGLFSVPINLPWTKFGLSLKARQKILKELERRMKSDSHGQDVLDHLLQGQLNTTEIKYQLLTLLFAGHDSLTSALTSFCLLIKSNPLVMSKLRAEIEQQIPQTSFSNPFPSLKNFPYNKQVVDEVLRCISPIPAGFRQVIKDCELNGYLFPQGWQVIYEITLTHRYSQIINNEAEFRPERFEEERKETQENYIPFGGGIRECLGKQLALLELQLFAIMLLANYDWEISQPQNLEITLFPNPHPVDGLIVKNFQRITS